MVDCRCQRRRNQGNRTTLVNWKGSSCASATSLFAVSLGRRPLKKQFDIPCVFTLDDLDAHRVIAVRLRQKPVVDSQSVSNQLRVGSYSGELPHDVKPRKCLRGKIELEPRAFRCFRSFYFHHCSD